LLLDPQDNHLFLDGSRHERKVLDIATVKNEAELTKAILQEAGIDENLPCKIVFSPVENIEVENDNSWVDLGDIYPAYKEDELGNYRIKEFSGGRGYYGTYLSKIDNDTDRMFTDQLGQTVENAQLVKTLPQGDLYYANVGMHGKGKAFFVKDGKIKPAGLGTLINIIKSL